MANYSAIKAAVNAYIKANGKKEITGRILNSVLNATIDSLGKEFQFGGVLTPADDPGQPDQNVAYIGAAGTYSNFDNLVIESGNIGIFLWNGDWSFETIPVGKDYDNDIQSLTNGLQELSENIQELSDNVIHLDGINEEDLSIPEGGKLQFANRVYNAQQPNGMGYVILRKNKTFAEQVTESNTIYEIRDTFNLGGVSVNIPAGCVLYFNGGKISNGTINGASTQIDATPYLIFDNISFSGSFLCEAFPEWVGDIPSAFYAFKNVKLVPNKSYSISKPLVFSFDNRLNGNGAVLDVDSTNISGALFTLGHLSQVRNLTIVCDKTITVFDISTNNLTKTYYEKNRNITNVGIVIENVNIETSYTATIISDSIAIRIASDGYSEHGTEEHPTISGFFGVTLQNVQIAGAWGKGISFNTGLNANATRLDTSITDCKVMNCFGSRLKTFLYFGQDDQYTGTIPARTRNLYNIVVNDCSTQNINSDWFIDIEYGVSLSFSNCKGWDFPGNVAVRVNRDYSEIINFNDLFGEISYTGTANANPVSLLKYDDVLDSHCYNIDETDAGYVADTHTQFTVADAKKLDFGLIVLAQGNNTYKYFGLAANNFINLDGSTHLVFIRKSKIAGNAILLELFTSHFFGNFRGTFVIFNTTPDSTVVTWSLLGRLNTYNSISDLPANEYGKGNLILVANRPCYSFRSWGKYDSDGHSFGILVGSTSQRPTLNASNDRGYRYFDTTLDEEIFWTGARWVDGCGFSATKKSGATRPTGTGGGGVLDATKDIGFCFFDTSINKPIYASAIAADGTVTWVDATGASV